MNIPPGAVIFDDNFGMPVLNATEVSNSEVYEALQTQDNSILKTFGDWAQSTRLSASAAGSYGMTMNRNGGLLMRDRFVAPAGVFDQMRLAYEALDDDVVSGVADTTESLAFSAVDFYAEDPDEEDIYNQIAAQIDLDSRLREIWRELFTVSQVYVAVWWTQQTFKVRGKTADGNQRRRSFTVRAPQELMLLDPLKIIPVGVSAFGKGQLAYIAEPYESDQFGRIVVDLADPSFRDRIRDPIVERLITGRYQPSRAERLEMVNLGINPEHLWLLNKDNVFRHTVTKAGYQRFPQIRMRSVFELLDMKQQLRQMERAHLIGGTNFIVVITKGTDAHPAQPAEIANLHVQARTVGRVPVMVGDHRLHVDIVTPKLDNTLKAERWNTIDSRITSRLYGMFMLGNYAAGAANDDSVKLAKVIARGMESRRHMIRRTLEEHIFKPLFEDNEFTSRPKLQFHPRSIALDFDAAWASFLMDLRAANDLSRETMLNQFDLDQELEAELRKREKEEYDDIFQTQVPFSTPNPALNPGQQPVQPNVDPAKQAQPAGPAPTQRDNGGGRRNGGGAAPGSGQGQPPRRVTRKASERSGTAAARVEPTEITVGVDADEVARRIVKELRAQGLIKGDADDEATD